MSRRSAARTLLLLRTRPLTARFGRFFDLSAGALHPGVIRSSPSFLCFPGTLQFAFARPGPTSPQSLECPSALTSAWYSTPIYLCFIHSYSRTALHPLRGPPDSSGLQTRRSFLPVAMFHFCIVEEESVSSSSIGSGKLISDFFSRGSPPRISQYFSVFFPPVFFRLGRGRQWESSSSVIDYCYRDMVIQPTIRTGDRDDGTLFPC